MSRKALSWMILAGVGLVLFVLMKSSTKDTRENVFEAPPQVSLDDEAPALYTDDIHPVPAGTTPEPPHEDAPAGAATTVEREVPISGLVWTALVPDIDSGGVLTPVSQLYNDLLNESRDEVWASQIEIELKDYLARLPVSSVLEETTIECRQSLCVVAATADSATLSSMGEFNWDSAMFSIADGATGQRIEAKTGTLVVSQDFPHRIGFATIFSRKD